MDRGAEALGPRPVDEPSGMQRPPVRLPELAPFMDACLATLPRPVAALRPKERLGLCLFLLGAADRLWDRLGLDERRYPAAAEAILREFGVGQETAATIVSALPQAAREPFGQRALAQGARTFDHWYGGADANSVLVVPELIAEWDSESDAP